MKKNLIEEVRRFVEEESKKPTSVYGYESYEFHFIPMRNYAVKLAKKLDADVEVVEISAWLHDIGSIINGRENHHQTGAEIAESKLKEFGYPLEKIKMVKYCILNHRGSIRNYRTSLEEKIISDADALSHFDNVAGLFNAAFIEGLDEKQAMQSVLTKLTNSWNKLEFDESKEIIKPKYDAAKILLK